MACASPSKACGLSTAVVTVPWPTGDARAVRRVSGIRAMSMGMLRQVRKKIQDPRVTFSVADMRHLPYPDQHVDVAVCAWALKILAQLFHALLALLPGDACPALQGRSDGRPKRKPLLGREGRDGIRQLAGGARLPTVHMEHGRSEQGVCLALRVCQFPGQGSTS
jgi:hypothetical protein